jgi:hypothetical protein
MVDEKQEKNPKKIQWDKLDVGIEHDGRAITLPAEPGKMPVRKAIEALERKEKDENQPFAVHERFDAYPHDAAVAFTRAMAELYGWSSPQTVMTFFGPKPPQMISVKTGFRDEDVVQCPMGAFLLPGVDEQIHTVIHDFEDGKGPQFICHANIKKKDRHTLLELATKTRDILRRESIYRGKPIRLRVDDCGDLETANPPEFLDVTEMTEESLVFDADLWDQIITNLLVPLRETTLCRKHNIPLKRGILLEGPYGTGKTLVARLTAREAELAGWTFILLDKAQGLKTALEFANRYAPAVVFAEDIDRIAEHRDDATNDLVNTIDGVVSKKAEVMTVLTTNFVTKLDPVILRPGRLDAVISIKPPGPKAVERLLRYYAGDLLSEEVTLAEAGHELAGQIPASIRECVERAKLGMIGRRAQDLAEHDFVVAAKTMKNHLALLNPKPPTLTPAEKLADGLKEVILNGTAKLVTETHEKMGALHEHFGLE